MAKEKRKFEQHFYVGDVIQDPLHGGDFQWKVLSAKFVEDDWTYDYWEYDAELIGWGDVENLVIYRLYPHNYIVLQPGEARLWA